MGEGDKWRRLGGGGACRDGLRAGAFRLLRCDGGGGGLRAECTLCDGFKVLWVSLIHGKGGEINVKGTYQVHLLPCYLRDGSSHRGER